jgi:glycine cleavage system H protein
MSSLLAILAVLVLLIVEKIWPRKKKAPVFARRYFHPGHTWAQVDEAGEALVGIDDFAAGVLGTIDSVTLPRYLKVLRQGEPAFELSTGNRKVRLLSPISGAVIEKNEMVLQNPSLVLTSPLQDGWLLKVHPRRHAASELRNLISGKLVPDWLDVTRAHLVRFFSSHPILTAQDGGTLTKDLAARCSDSEWDALTREFFLSPQSYHAKETRQ